MYLIDKILFVLLLIISFNQNLLEGEHLKGYYYNKSANKYFKIESTTVKPKSTTTSTTTTTTTTTESTIERNDDLKKLTDAQIVNHAQQLNEQQKNQTSLNTKIQSNYESELEMMERPKINMLDFISGMSKAIHLLLYQRDPMKGNLDSQESSVHENNQTNSQREQISIFRPLKVNSKVPPEGLPSDYRAQAELLRQQITRRCNQLQNIIKTTNEILRERENHMFVKILDNFSSRIEQTKTKSDLILKEPSTSITAVKALNRINYGLNNMNHLVQNVLSRVNVSINLDMKENQKESKRESKRLKDKSNKNQNKKENSTSSSVGEKAN